ncbi:E3 ubiquitin-protein ligase PRT1 [Ziziphus jujuba]|uniref:E3 ubiquitin-protein ligase PRT1 n=1 Tax=Ziziphus jujuba TaxID=326968 RepID=A0A6P4ATS7_ZIZJJ|nr:E3 ubiquitin-protein ligase PRT1 [Ziziphus jujuba]
MEDRTSDGVKSEEISESFICCVCLDLLYKPIVLCCGHVSCFWCVHKSMNGLRESHCPICRNSYNHFPTICQMLHFLLQKMYPIAYKARELQVLEEEKENDCFSPQLDAHAHNLQADQDLENPACKESSATMKQLDSISHISDNGTTVPEQGTNGNPEATGIAIDIDKNFPQNQHSGNCKQISVADVLCAACKQMLFCPVVLNCGHVYCESCAIGIAGEMLKCQVCQSPQPKGLPKVCLELGNFLEEQFPKEYALRRDAVRLKEVDSNRGWQTNGSTEGGKQADILAWWSDPHSKVHMNAGCDSCGMYPIIGDRYRCTDCVEKIGFDLCGDCYNTRSKLPGRFNQQHTPEHKFELVPSNMIRNIMLRLVTGPIDDGSTLLITADGSENLEDLSSPPSLSGVTEENVENSLAIPATSGDGAEEHQDDSQTTEYLN